MWSIVVISPDNIIFNADSNNNFLLKRSIIKNSKTPKSRQIAYHSFYFIKLFIIILLLFICSSKSKLKVNFPLGFKKYSIEKSNFLQDSSKNMKVEWREKDYCFIFYFLKGSKLPELCCDSFSFVIFHYLVKKIKKIIYIIKVCFFWKRSFCILQPLVLHNKKGPIVLLKLGKKLKS